MGIVSMNCPGCGQTIELDESREFGFCTYCGTKVTIDKMVVEHRGSVTVDKSNEEENLLNLALNYFDKGDFKKTIEFCEKVLTINSNNENAFKILNYCQKAEEEKTKVCFWEADMTSEEGLEVFYNDVQKILKTDSVKSEIKILSTKSEYYRFAKFTGHRKATYVATVDYKPVSGVVAADLTNYYCFSNALSKELDTIDLNSSDYNKYSPYQAALFDIDKSAKEIFTKFSSKVTYNVFEVDFQKQKISPAPLDLDKSRKDEEKVFCYRRTRSFNEDIYYECEKGCPSYNVDNLNIFESDTTLTLLWMPMQIIDFEYDGNKYKALQYLTKDYPRVFTTFYTGDTIYRDSEFIQAYLQGNTSKVFNMVKQYESKPNINYVPGNDYVKTCIKSFEEYNKPFLNTAGITINTISQSNYDNTVFTNNEQNLNSHNSSGKGGSIFLLLLGLAMAIAGIIMIIVCISMKEILAALLMGVCGIVGGALIKLAISNLKR